MYDNLAQAMYDADGASVDDLGGVALLERYADVAASIGANRRRSASRPGRRSAKTPRGGGRPLKDVAKAGAKLVSCDAG